VVNKNPGSALLGKDTGDSPANDQTLKGGARITVLVVDDHALFREGTKEILGKFKDIHVVGVASNAKETQELATALNPDVILLDVRLSTDSGIDIARELLDEDPTRKILMLSAYDESDYIRRAMAVGAAGYMLKTASGSKLADAIRTVHSNSTVLDVDLAKALMEVSIDNSGSNTNERLKNSDILGQPNPVSLDASRGQPDLTSLTQREIEILNLVIQGMTNKSIASVLKVSRRTIEVHLSHIFAKLGVSSRVQLIVYVTKGDFKSTP
jgi:DNA-binding NarL/FixJ family response regulator